MKNKLKQDKSIPPRLSICIFYLAQRQIRFSRTERPIKRNGSSLERAF